jgi:hypothetical protein
MLNPLVALGYAFTGFRIEHVEPAEAPSPIVVGSVETTTQQRLRAPGGDRHVE